MSYQEKPTAAFILSLIGGIIGLIISSILFSTYYFIDVNLRGARFPSYHSENALIGLWVLFPSLLVVIGAAMMYSRPTKAKTWGIIVLVFSTIGLGSILGLVGGILAIVWKPTQFMPPSPITKYEPASPYPVQYPQPITRICPQCGRVLTPEVKFCPYCGKQLG